MTDPAFAHLAVQHALGDDPIPGIVHELALGRPVGEGHQGEPFEAYGIKPDEERIRYYRALWHLES